MDIKGLGIRDKCKVLNSSLSHVDFSDLKFPQYQNFEVSWDQLSKQLSLIEKETIEMKNGMRTTKGAIGLSKKSTYTREVIINPESESYRSDRL